MNLNINSGKKNTIMIIKRYRLIAVTFFFLSMTIVMTLPLVFRFTDSAAGGYGDGVYFIWLIRWYQGVIFQGHGAPFFNAMMNYPEGWNLSTTDTALASALPGVPFSLLMGPTAGYNIAMAITFILSGLFMYIWVVYLTSSKSAGLIAGMIYAFLPYRMAHFLAGHLNLSGTAWFPLFFMGYFEVLHHPAQKKWWPPVIAGISLGLIALTSMYYLYFTLLFVVIIFLGYLILVSWRVVLQKAFWIKSLIAALISSPFLFVALKPFLKLSQSGGIADRSLDYANNYSASPTDFFTFSSDHFLFGKWISSIFDRSLWIESSLYIGSVALILILFLLIKKHKKAQRALIRISLLVMVSAFILALGPSLHWNNRQVILHIPGWLQSFSNLKETIIPLPTWFLFNHLPFYAKMRAVMRVGFFVLIFSSMLAGLGAAGFLNKFSKGKKRWLTILIIGLVFFDFYPGSFANTIKKIEARPVDHWLAEQPGKGAVIQMPFEESTSQDQIYYTLTHKKPITGGFFNANQPPQYLYLKPILDRFPDEKSIATLKEYKVQYVLINPLHYQNFKSVEETMLQLGLKKIVTLDGISVYEFEK
jgi:hypothetical protein